MPSPFLVEVTCPECKINLRVNRIEISQNYDQTSEPSEEGVIRCPSCRAPVFKVSFSNGARS